MPEISSSQAILIGYFVAPVIFALCAYFTRSSMRRTVSGLVGAFIYSLVQYIWDRIASTTGWWSYPAYGTIGILPDQVG